MSTEIASVKAELQLSQAKEIWLQKERQAELAEQMISVILSFSPL